MPMACKSHERRRAEILGARERTGRRIYSPEDRRIDGMRTSQHWRRLRAWYFAQRPTCLDPFKKHSGRIVPATEIHHIVPARSDISLLLDPENLVSVCHSCHMKLEAMIRAGVDTKVIIQNALRRVPALEMIPTI